jgi:thioredoxin reductase (NADPH)
MPARSNNPPGELEYLAGAVEDIDLIPGEYVAHEGEGRLPGELEARSR